MVQMFMRDLKKVSALERPLWRGFVIRDSLGIRPGQNFLSVLERCPLYRMSALGRFHCTLMNAFFKPQFNYCPLIWMCCNRSLNNKIDRFHERSLRIVYSDKISDFSELLTGKKWFCLYLLPKYPTTCN